MPCLGPLIRSPRLLFMVGNLQAGQRGWLYQPEKQEERLYQSHSKFREHSRPACAWQQCGSKDLRCCRHFKGYRNSSTMFVNRDQNLLLFSQLVVYGYLWYEASFSASNNRRLSHQPDHCSKPKFSRFLECMSEPRSSLRMLSALVM